MGVLLGHGGSTFAEDPNITAHKARIIWSVDVDPGTIELEALPAAAGDRDAIDPAAFASWLSIVAAQDGREHIVIGDGFRRIRLDVIAGSLAKGPVYPRYRLGGIGSLRSRVLPLRRLLALCKHRRFVVSLFPEDPKMGRLVDMLRVHDGIVCGASLSDLVSTLYGRKSDVSDARGYDSMRSRARRLVREARALAAGGYRQLMRS
ncbi:DNA -binding domain-containing protein [Novosphingobium sp.]|jgi:hypothetical protein|uniref:DNA -binding domain-containing protein n=1 Tax=Novosphingobium sp. TaxID=1874826 RepID=UPI002FE1FAB1